MASAVSTPTYLSSSSSFAVGKSVLCSCLRAPKFHFTTRTPELGLSPFSPWNGLRHLGISISQLSVKIEMKRKRKWKAVYASLFGVGAPEALVIGVVALLVFGPKGLAEVARNLGKTLRAFQPTIRELQEVSKEFKSTLEREIGIDDIETSRQDIYSSKTSSTAPTASSVASTEEAQTMVDPNGASSPNRAYSSEDYLTVTEEQLKASTVQQQSHMPLGDSQSESQSQPEDSVQEAAAVISPHQKKAESET